MRKWVSAPDYLLSSASDVRRLKFVRAGDKSPRKKVPFRSWEKGEGAGDISIGPGFKSHARTITDAGANTTQSNPRNVQIPPHTQRN